LKIFGFKFGKSETEIKDLAIKEDVQVNNIEVINPGTKSPSTIQHVDAPFFIYTQTGGNVTKPSARRMIFEPAEYDLYEIGRVEDSEAYVRQAFKKKVGLFLKEGFDYIGPNKRAVKYIKTRFAQLARASSIPHAELIRRIASSLVRKSNAFLVKVRDVDASGGSVRVDNGKKLKPIAAYFPLPPETVEIETDGSGKPMRYRQRLPNGINIEFAPQDIVHFTFDRKEGFLFGTPTLTPVIDDIRALRRIEENVELLVYKHLFPMFQYIVGTEQLPAGLTEDGLREIDVAKQMIQYMPSEGGIVTPERHKIEMIGAEGKALRAEAYLEHFKRRVFAGLGMSAVDYGEGDCYSSDTETLTETGWKLHTDIDHTKDKIATFNSSTNKIEFSIPNSKYEGRYIGDMVNFKGKFFDISVTPKHDMWVKNRHNKALGWHKVKARELLAGRYQEFCILDRVNSHEFGNQTQIKIPKAPTKNGRTGRPAKDLSVLDTGDFCEFLGHYISEGCLDKYNATKNAYRILITQNTGKKLNKIIENLDRLKFSYSVKKGHGGTSQTVVIYSKDLYFYLDQYVGNGAINKNIPMEQIKIFPLNAHERLLEGLILGDGSVRSTGSTYYTRSKQLADDVNRLGFLLGYSTVIKLTPQTKKAFGIEPIYKISLNKGRSHRYVKLNQISKQHYDGPIYCYNVPNHLFATRHNGYITIQGNSSNRATADNMSRALVDDVKDFQDSFEAQFNEYIVNELLLESTFPEDMLLDENRVQIFFREIDIDKQIKMENHAADLFAKHGLTWDELRSELGLNTINVPIDPEDQDPIKYPEWHLTFWKLFHEPEKLISAVDEPYSAASIAAAKLRATAITGTDVQAAQKAKSTAEENIAKIKKPTIRKKDNFLLSEYTDMRDIVLHEIRTNEDSNLNMIKKKIQLVAERMIVILQTKMNAAFLSGIGTDIAMNVPIEISIVRKNIQDRSQLIIKNLSRDIEKALTKRIDMTNPNDKLLSVQTVFDTFRYRTDFISKTEVQRANNLGKVFRVRHLGATKGKYTVSMSTCEICKEHTNSLVNLEDYTLNNIPPHHPNCECGLQIAEVKNG